MYQISRLVIARETIYIYACICTTQISRLVIARETISIRVYIYMCVPTMEVCRRPVISK
jgi:hypothetical protein